MPLNPLIISDEPAKNDLLGRQVFARTLQKIAQSCETPIVIGVHGDWGSGKTSLMQLTQRLLEKEGTKTVWFNPWIYQFDESPIISLLNEIRKQAIHYQIRIEGLKLLSLLTSLTGEAILRIITGGTVNSEYLLKQGKNFEEKYFEAKSVTMNIHKHFQEVVNAIVGKEGRLVVFIDDLDRCCPPQSLKVLEAIKLFLNVDKCVYIIGMDREVIEKVVTKQYDELKLSGISYLDKIIQLPFKLPPVTDEGINNYLDKLGEHSEIKPYYGIIRKGTSHNPRAIKRFVNTFLFNHTLAQEENIENYKPNILIKLLIIQLRYPDLYRYISQHETEFERIEEWAYSGKTVDEFFPNASDTLKENLNDLELGDILREQPRISNEDIKPYIHLTNITNIRHSYEPTPISHDGNCPKCGGPGEVYDKGSMSDSSGDPPYEFNYCRCLKCGLKFEEW